MRRTAVLLMAFGGPESLDQVGPFMSRLMGRPPAPPILERVVGRYRLIGGGSPLPRIVRRQAEALERRFARENVAVPVRAAFKYADPSIGDAVGQLAQAGFEKIVGVSLSPHYARISTGAYLDELGAAGESTGVEVVSAGPLFAEPNFLSGIAEKTVAALSRLSDSGSAILVFSAHSLPVGQLAPGDSYVAELEATVRGVLDRVPGHDWWLAYQSHGMAPGKWLEPSVEVALVEIAARGRRRVVLVPIGFTSDHVETLYDIDVVIAGKAGELGLEFARAEVLNDSLPFIESLYAVSRPHVD